MGFVAPLVVSATLSGGRARLADLTTPASGSKKTSEITNL